MQNHNARSVSDFNTELKLKGFNVFQIETDSNATRVYSRKDFYKICLTTGKSIIHYAEKSFETEGTILFFGNPHIPYSWETLSTTYTGYTCLFSEDFFATAERSESLQQSPLFKLGGTPILKINESQREFLNTIFCKMIEEHKTDYAYKDDLIRNYINLIMPDDRIMIFYSRHTDEPCFYYRVSTKPGDITTLGKEMRLETEFNTTYPSPFFLSDDPNHFYLCWRGINWHPTIARLTLPDANDDVKFDWGPYQIVRSKKRTKQYSSLCQIPVEWKRQDILDLHYYTSGESTNKLCLPELH